MLLFTGALMFADNTVAVLEFETKDSELRSKMPILTDIFRSELANTASVNCSAQGELGQICKS